MFYPSEDELYKTIHDVLEMDINEFKAITMRAYESAITTFSRETWAEKWITVINKVMSSKWLVQLKI